MQIISHDTPEAVRLSAKAHDAIVAYVQHRLPGLGPADPRVDEMAFHAMSVARLACDLADRPGGP